MTSDSDADAVDDRSWARRFHDHTHEAELLVSGALLFRLLQAPDLLDAVFDYLRLRLADTAWWAMFFVWYYFKLIAYALTISLGLHLVARAYWIGLVGLDSAFPEGVDWDELRYGPIAKRAYQALVPPLSTMARRTDRFASAIFAFAFLVVSIFLMTLAFAVVIAVPTFLLGLLLPAMDWRVLWASLLGLFALLPLIAASADRLLGDRLDADSTAARLIDRLVRAFYLRTGSALFTPVQFVLFTRVPRTLIQSLYFGFLLVLLAVFMASFMLNSGSMVLAADELLPNRPGYRSVDARYFAPTRDPASTAPFIQSEIVEGPYLRLELPFEMRREAQRAEQACAEAGVIGSASAPARGHPTDPPADADTTAAVLQCLAGLWEVKLDARPQTVAWDFYSEPGSGVTALLAYFPTEPLAPGVHTLEIAETFSADFDADGAVDTSVGTEEPELRHHIIRFRI